VGKDGRQRLAAAAAFLVAATALSRVLGLFREQVMLYYLGLGSGMGAFTVAFKIPSLIRALVADTALSAAFIPVFSELLEKERRREAWQVARTVTMLSTLVLGVISLLGMVFAPQVVRLTAPGLSPQTQELAVELTRIMFPTVVLFGAAGIFMGILNAYDHFTLPALAPILWNVVIIASVALFARRYQTPGDEQAGFVALSWGIVAGTAAELLIQVPAVLRRAEGGARLFAPLRHPAVRQVGALLVPIVLSLGVVNFNVLIDTIFASLISDPAPAVIDKAYRLFQLPQGMFAIAIGTVLFPTLSRLAATARFGEFRAGLTTGIKQVIFMTLPFVAFFIILAQPTIRLVFEHGKMTAADTEQVARALMFFSPGMVFVSATTLLSRGFYGIQKTWVPLTVGVVNLILNALLDWLLYRPLGVGGVTLATSIVSAFNYIALLYLLGREVGRLDTGRIWSAWMKALLALVPLVGGGYGAWWALDGWLGRSNPAQLVSVAAGYLVGGLLYLGAARLLRMEELDQLLGLLRRRRAGGLVGR